MSSGLGDGSCEDNPANVCVNAVRSMTSNLLTLLPGHLQTRAGDYIETMKVPGDSGRILLTWFISDWAAVVCQIGMMCTTAHFGMFAVVI